MAKQFQGEEFLEIDQSETRIACGGIIQVISKLLDPKTSEHTASFVGRLVSVVIGKVGSQLGENLDLMLRAVLSKMQQAETLTVIQVLKVDILAGTDINPYMYVYGVYWIIPVHLSHFYIITNKEY
jgi:hypothetical protein